MLTHSLTHSLWNGAPHEYRTNVLDLHRTTRTGQPHRPVCRVSTHRTKRGRRRAVGNSGCMGRAPRCDTGSRHRRPIVVTGDGDRLRSVCPECGSVFTREDRVGRCTECQPTNRGGRTEHAEHSARRGYDRRWRALSERARRLQPYCSDCGRQTDLTADHTPEAWNRRESGRSIRLQDIDVVCRRCNAERGAARGENIAPINRSGRLHRLTDRCPICRAQVRPNEYGAIRLHTIGNGRGNPCPMSGQPFPDQ